MSKTKSTHDSKGIAEHSGDHGSLWKAFNKLLHRCPKCTCLISHGSWRIKWNWIQIKQNYSLLGKHNDFVFEHQSGCCATEPGYAGDIGAIEIWLIDLFIDLHAVCGRMSTLAIMGHYGRHLANSYTVALSAPAWSFLYCCSSEHIQLVFH